MKKYITLAALLAAGTTFANAEELVWNFSWGTDSALTLTPEVEKWTSKVSATTATYETPDKSTPAEYKTTSYQSGTFTPNINVGNAGSWTLNFSLTNGTEKDFVFDGIELEVFTHDSNGVTQANATDRSIKFTLGGDLAGEKTETIQGKPANEGGSLRDLTLSVSNTPIIIAAGETLNFTLKAEKGPSETLGTFVGLKSISLVPEPSAFGMLAGAGALALVAARRRRK